MITPELALRLRRRGLMLWSQNVTAELYSTPRLFEIAQQQYDLMAEMNRLDDEIKTMAEQKSPDDLTKPASKMLLSNNRPKLNNFSTSPSQQGIAIRPIHGK